ncbi:MAG: Gfo/Idh/MocA family oxidoreductase [Verrucomicrobiota bacterium]|nr:Gfo/Idh/MocA family oxidoreductase [Verrucomicrobiota bacterium]
MKQLRVGVIGVGHIGSNHARIYSELPQAELASVFDSDATRAREIATKFKTRAASTLTEFADAIDAASIATPTPTHFALANDLLMRGKHLLIEKPITEKTEDARELARLAAEKRLVLQVGHVERFNPVLSALEERLTQPRFIEASRLSPYPGRSVEIGVVLDLMIHDLEIILHLVRSPIAQIDAVGVPVVSRGEDIANVRLRFENGCVANITASRISQERLRKIRVFQQDAYLSLDYQKQEGYLLRMAREGEKETSMLGKILGAATDARIVTEFAGRKIVREPVVVAREEPLRQQLASFVDCAMTGGEPRVSGSHAAAALELAVEITKQIASGD